MPYLSQHAHASSISHPPDLKECEERHESISQLPSSDCAGSATAVPGARERLVNCCSQEVTADRCRGTGSSPDHSTPARAAKMRRSTHFSSHSPGLMQKSPASSKMRPPQSERRRTKSPSGLPLTNSCRRPSAVVQNSSMSSSVSVNLTLSGTSGSSPCQATPAHAASARSTIALSDCSAGLKLKSPPASLTSASAATYSRARTSAISTRPA
mmetsp:Transcript_14286/g.33576  ORF Transcript_14286/g.33576 Transcript_14286/m.33576 type:complete len:212 (+) Transcript_14286:62-697(+)